LEACIILPKPVLFVCSIKDAQLPQRDQAWSVLYCTLHLMISPVADKPCDALLYTKMGAECDKRGAKLSGQCAAAKQKTAVQSFRNDNIQKKRTVIFGNA